MSKQRSDVRIPGRNGDFSVLLNPYKCAGKKFSHARFGRSFLYEYRLRYEINLSDHARTIRQTDIRHMTKTKCFTRDEKCPTKHEMSSHTFRLFCCSIPQFIRFTRRLTITAIPIRKQIICARTIIQYVDKRGIYLDCLKNDSSERKM